MRGLRSIVHGFGMLETHGTFLTSVDRDASFRHVLQTFVQGIEHSHDIEESGGTPKAPKKQIATRNRALKTTPMAKRNPAIELKMPRRRRGLA